MADRGALSLPRASTYLSFSNLHVWRFHNPRSYPPSRSQLLCFSSSCSRVTSAKIIQLNRRRFSYKICAAADDGRGYRLTERGKRGRKRRELWEELFEDNVEDDDDEDDGGGGIGSANFDLWKILEEIVDNVWILKAFKSYGYLLPFIILSLFFSTGPKAFLVSLAVAIGPSLLFYAFQKLIGWDKRRGTSIANQFGIEEEEEEVERSSSRIRYNPSTVRNNVNGRGVNRSSAGMASKFGGWDELDGLGTTIPERPTSEPKKKPLPKRKRVRREKAAEPLLLRLLVSLFPFLSTYTNMLK
ncbi:transmembrane protein [Arabidopsis thaliana]|uniref:At2g33250/F25I18.1 n=1 Tax=Arabidopsis thaliana TaxID=3702 RepID=O22777_ARATH|nr:uncharacterized protein AT2G33250 [Arabidopsis thaliana]AAB80643.2 Expressed protein [Arabidopsis thaliana]AAK73955.1 F25I18.1/F25I18.1 [Arabidopsis thaliana]AAM14805.1 Expressed protein [Arabidopsis thaliana]AAM19902.1 At2g33250/F25I18.1 [Arabidopsis thaliana]AEC08805.1 transmembrane protein [Arabidopsis thaliana]|eukprot:NP_565762.1 transmembrane protein [Arabidopsis thaliana]